MSATSGPEKTSGADTPNAADAATAAATAAADETAAEGLEMQSLQNFGTPREIETPKNDDDQFGFQGDEVSS